MIEEFISELHFVKIISSMKEALVLLEPLLVLLNFTLIVIGFFYTIRHYKFNRTWSYIERYDAADFIQTRKHVEMFKIKLNSFETDEDKKRYVNELLSSEVESDIEMNLHLSRYINLFTELGVVYRSGAWSQKAFVSIAKLVIDSWEKLEYYIKAVQALHKPNQIHNSFEILYLFVKRKGWAKMK